jgi:signal peptidase I
MPGKELLAALTVIWAPWAWIARPMLWRNGVKPIGPHPARAFSFWALGEAAPSGQPAPSFMARLVWGRSPRRTLFRILILVVLCYITFEFILLPIRVTGASMEPTCPDGRVGFINLLAYKWREPQRGDIVGVLVGPENELVLKRLVALPGERIAIHDGQVFINGAALDEPYVIMTGNSEWPEETLANGSYFVDGDNREVSREFRVGRNQILGKLVGSKR